MNEIRNTLDGVTIKDQRGCGNSTRQVDRAIQILFEDGEVLILDHHMNGHNSDMNEFLFEKVVRRITVEYRNMVQQKRFVFNRGKSVIEIIPI